MSGESVIILVVGGGFFWVVAELGSIARILKELVNLQREIKNSTAIAVAHLDALRSELKRKGVT